MRSLRKLILYHFSVFFEAVGLPVSGGSYLRRAERIFPAVLAEESVNEVMNSTPPSFHSPATSTKTEETLMLWWTREQSLDKKASPFWKRSGMLYSHTRLKYTKNYRLK